MDSHINTFTQLIQNQLPPSHQIPAFIIIKLLTFMRSILLTYPVNLITIYALLFGMIYRVICYVRNPKTFEYWPEEHVERETLEIRDLKKQVREIQREIIQIKNKAIHEQKEYHSHHDQWNNKKSKKIEALEAEIEQLLREKVEMESISEQMQHEVRESLSQMLHTLKKIQS